MTVETTETADDVEVLPAIPMFEGKHVDFTTLRFSSSSKLELPDVVLHVDDIIQLVVEARVTGVSHDVVERTGQLARVQTAKPLDARLLPFNPEYDDGIVRDDQ
jgi:hypothetical protein